MLALHTRQAAAVTQTDQELYQRQLDATDRQIDQLVYELVMLRTSPPRSPSPKGEGEVGTRVALSPSPFGEGAGGEVTA